LKPGQPREDERPGTVPRVKKYDFGGEALFHRFFFLHETNTGNKIKSIDFPYTQVLLKQILLVRWAQIVWCSFPFSLVKYNGYVFVFSLDSDFDEDDPLAGLLDDDDSVSEAVRKPKKPALKEQKSQEDEPKAAQPCMFMEQQVYITFNILKLCPHTLQTFLEIHVQ
jgi:hypothetical protein